MLEGLKRWCWLVGVLCLWGCEVEVQDKTRREATAEQPAELPGPRDLEAFRSLKEQRLAAGDTLAVSHDVLDELIGEELPGFVREIDKASTFTTQDFSFSEATKVFFDSLENYLSVVAGDYSANLDFIEVVLGRYNQADSSGGGLVERRLAWRPEEIPAEMDFFAWESLQPGKETALACFALDHRFFISVEETGTRDFISRAVIDDLLHWEVLAAEFRSRDREKSSRD